MYWRPSPQLRVLLNDFAPPFNPLTLPSIERQWERSAKTTGCCPHDFMLSLIQGYRPEIYLTWGPSTWGLISGCSPLFSLILLNVSQHRSLTAIGQKIASSPNWFSLDKHVIEIERRTQVRPTWSIFEYCSFGQNLKSTPGQAKPITQYFFNNSIPLDAAKSNAVAPFYLKGVWICCILLPVLVSFYFLKFIMAYIVYLNR